MTLVPSATSRIFRNWLHAITIRAWLPAIAIRAWLPAIAITLFTVCPTQKALAGRNEWRPVGPGIAEREATISGPSFFSSTLTLLRVSLKENRIGVLRAAEGGKVRADVQTLVERSHAILGINANFFDQGGAPLGLVVSRGILHNKLHRGGSTLTAVLQGGLSGARIVGRSDFQPEGVIEAVQAGPRLLRNGKAVTSLKDTSYSRRAGVCLNNVGELILFCSSSGFLGITLGQLQEALQRSEIGCVDAINFDGGGSAQLFANIPPVAELPGLNLEIKGDDEVPVVLGIFPASAQVAEPHPAHEDE